LQFVQAEVELSRVADFRGAATEFAPRVDEFGCVDWVRAFVALVSPGVLTDNGGELGERNK
jgi:hypothetical protein